jgi:hypothetical protein
VMSEGSPAGWSGAVMRTGADLVIQIVDNFVGTVKFVGTWSDQNEFPR